MHIRGRLVQPKEKEAPRVIRVIQTILCRVLLPI